jgi:hypothetical protein
MFITGMRRSAAGARHDGRFRMLQLGAYHSLSIDMHKAIRVMVKLL